MARTSYSVSQITNTSNSSMGLYITDPNNVEHFIAEIPAGSVTAQLMPIGAKWAWKPVIAQSDVPILAPATPFNPNDTMRRLGEGNDGGRKTLD